MLTQTEKHQASAAGNEAAPNLDRVISVPEWCEMANISTSTGWRMVAANTSPRITRLSPRRIGIRYRHYLEWCEARCEKNVA